MDPNFPRAHLIMAAYVEKGMFAEALTDTEKLRPVTPDAWYWSKLAYIYGRCGRTAGARDALHQLFQSHRRDPIDPQAVAEAYAGLGDKDRALAWLEKAYEQHSNEIVALRVSPAYDPLRGDPRFQDLIRRIGLAP
jgi:Flp pilus assembly protein TadD